MELNSIENILATTGIVVGTGLAFASLVGGESTYHQAKENYAQLDELHRKDVQPPTRKETYVTAIKIALTMCHAPWAYKVINNSNSGKIENAIATQKMQKAAWGENYELMPKQ